MNALEERKSLEMNPIKKAPSLNKWLLENDANSENETELLILPNQMVPMVLETATTKKQKGPTTKQKLIGAIFLTILTSSGGILMQLSKVQGVYLYNTATVPLLAELLKLGISGALLMLECGSAKDGATVNMTYEGRTVVKYILPSILYLFCNNLSLEILRHLKPSTYQVLGNLRIVTTGLLTVTSLGRPLARIQWIALVLMTLGATTTQLGEDFQEGDGEGEGEHDIGDRVTGYLLSLLLCFLASLAGVYTERVMKGNQDSIHWQNIQLYGFGLVFNALRLTLDDLSVSFNQGFWVLAMFSGYSFTTVLVIFNLAFSGLLVSFITKYVDAIAKNFATSLAMFLTPVVALPLFGHEPTFALCIGAIVAAISINLYYAKAEDLFPINANRSNSNIMFETAKQDPGSPNPFGSSKD